MCAHGHTCSTCSSARTLDVHANHLYNNICSHKHARIRHTHTYTHIHRDAHRHTTHPPCCRPVSETSSEDTVSGRPRASATTPASHSGFPRMPRLRTGDPRAAMPNKARDSAAAPRAVNAFPARSSAVARGPRDNSSTIATHRDTSATNGECCTGQRRQRLWRTRYARVIQSTRSKGALSLRRRECHHRRHVTSRDLGRWGWRVLLWSLWTRRCWSCSLRMRARGQRTN